jgi:hypothetical protein
MLENVAGTLTSSRNARQALVVAQAKEELLIYIYFSDMFYIQWFCNPLDL